MQNFGEQIKELEKKPLQFDPATGKSSFLRFSGESLGSVISGVLNYVFTFAGIALLLYFMYGGFQLFTSAGDQKKVSEGKATITNALIGFVVVFVAFWIVQLFGNLLGLKTLVGKSNTLF